ncbi:hypothetical protein ACLI4Y_12045 [Natrialbaceae archaeon A-CW3]
MLDTNHHPHNRIGTHATTAREHGRSLEELILDLLQGEFAGIIRSHVRGEVYGGR